MPPLSILKSNKARPALRQVGRPVKKVKKLESTEDMLDSMGAARFEDLTTDSFDAFKRTQNAEINEEMLRKGVSGFNRKKLKETVHVLADSFDRGHVNPTGLSIFDNGVKDYREVARMATHEEMADLKRLSQAGENKALKRLPQRHSDIEINKRISKTISDTSNVIKF